MAIDAYAATFALFEGKRWRSALSRAYYAAYAKVVAVLLSSGMTPPARGNPGHRSMPDLILNNMRSLDSGSRARLSGQMATLYNLRLVADYQPDAVVDESDFRVSAGLMARVFKDLKERGDEYTDAYTYCRDDRQAPRAAGRTFATGCAVGNSG
ncbi:MAG: HEPN domain-containing protein [Planctomycetes bacterium]|nr:HEPN domain-containing protein [Planctomycetota bacterium]